MRVVLLGGRGNFGARIASALAGDSTIEVIVASRSPSPVATGSATLDVQDPDFSSKLHALHPGLVIHCVGPFQGQGYRVVQAALASGAHYLDLADGRQFVAAFVSENEAVARAADRIAISGASTLPALSSAVVDALADSFRRIESIEVAIAPGQRATRGVATLQAVFSYLGRSFLWLQDGRWVRAFGWQELRRLRFDFGMRWAAACDVPDLELLPLRYPTVRTVTFCAALEFGIEHFSLWSLAFLRRAGLPIRVGSWAVRLDRLATVLDHFGGPHGGMQVRVTGIGAEGSPRSITWQLTVPAEQGPEIPCMPAILLTRRLAAGELKQRGAHACMGFLQLSDFESEFTRWGIRTRIEEFAP